MKKSLKMRTKAFLATEQRTTGLRDSILQDTILNAKIHAKRSMDDSVHVIGHFTESVIDENGCAANQDDFSRYGGSVQFSEYFRQILEICVEIFFGKKKII